MNPWNDVLRVVVATSTTGPDNQIFDYSIQHLLDPEDATRLDELVRRSAATLAMKMVERGQFYGHHIGPLKVISGSAQILTPLDSDQDPPTSSSDLSFPRAHPRPASRRRA